MKKMLLVLTLALAVLFVGCTSPSPSATPTPTPEQQQATPTPEPEETPTESPEETPEETDPQLPEAQNSLEAIEQSLQGLTENEYEGLEITAAVLPRAALMQGGFIPVTITVENKGEETIHYVQGSGSAEVPNAVKVGSADLQPVISKGNLGAMTMDYRVNELKPGKTLTYTINVLAVKPNASFDEYTNTLYNDGETYIGDLSWDELTEKYADLELVDEDSYSISAYFIYIVGAGEDNAVTSEPTGYAKASIDVGIVALGAQE